MNKHTIRTYSLRLLTALAALLIPALAPAGTPGSAAGDADTVYVHFRQSHDELLPELADNRAQLARLDSIFGPDGRVYSGVQGIRVLGAASPEGPLEFNRRLSRRRADAIHEYLKSLGEFPDSLFTFEYAGRDWHGLRELVSRDSNVPGRETVIAMLEEVPAEGLEAHEDNALLSWLKSMDGGRTYSYLYRNIFPRLRATRVVVDYPAALRERDHTPVHSVVLREGPPLSLGNLEAKPAGTISLGDLSARRFKPPFYMSIGTNLLYDAAALPTVRVEFYLGHDWSVGGNWTYGWWDSNRLHRYWRAYGGDLAIRRWFGRQAAEKPLTGHHAGVYAGIVTYDFEWGGTGYMGGLPEKTLWDRCNYMAGIEYGYSLPVARRLNLDFTIGIGCLWGKYIKYDPVDGYYQYRSTHNLRWFGPTKAEVSLVWLIGRGNYNKGKGGR
ncbi:MAG: DUF3575 domain-containing protein [Muribaculaceae bacterium]|nr:DUF3575 domain-containing protein [Muribaculaceae bacterium]